jgi:hypothetical protein
LTGDTNWLAYGSKWVSQKLSNGEFDYWLVLELVNMDEACGRDNEGQPRYHASLSSVSPDQARDKLPQAFDCCGLTDPEIMAKPLVQVECLHNYGVHAVLVQKTGNNAHQLLRDIKRESAVAEGLFGFYMDTPKNRIGTTGWEAIRGDMDSALARTIASGSTEGRILAKMHGITPA